MRFRLSIFLSLGAAATAVGIGCGNPTVTDLGASSTPTEASSATPTQAPTNTPLANAVCRDITVSPGKDGSAANNSVVLISALNSSDASEALGAGGFTAGGPVTLCAAPAVGNKSALTLLNDAVIAVSLPQSNCACAQLLATGTTGTLYGGPDADMLDFTVTKDSMAAGAGAAPVLTEGPGAVTAAGDLRVTFKARVGQTSGACTPDACATAVAAIAPSDLPFTTGTATSTMTNTKQGGTVTVSVKGIPFPVWTDKAQKGALAGGAAQVEDAPTVNDIAEVQRVAEQ